MARRRLVLLALLASVLTAADNPVEDLTTDLEPASADADRLTLEWIRRLAEESARAAEADATDAPASSRPAAPMGAKIYVPGAGVEVFDPTSEGSPANSEPSSDPPAVGVVGPGAAPTTFVVRGDDSALDFALSSGPASIDDLPDVVAVGTPRGWRCTGTLVAPGVVLTARHCLPATRIAVGVRAEPTTPFVAVARTYAHPKLDVALLVLSRAPEVASRPWRLADDPHPLSGYVRLAGFGSNRAGGSGGSGRKRSAIVSVEGWGCDAARARATGCNPSSELVIRVPERVDTCDGDSGGPAFEEQGGRWQLIGVTSRPIAGASARCGDGGIYTRVDRISGWMLDTLAHEGIRPPAPAKEIE